MIRRSRPQNRPVAREPLRGALLLACLLGASFFSNAHAAEPIQGGYSTQPLEAAVFEPAKVAVELVAFNEWLNGNHASLTRETMKGPREHLYYLIGSWVSSLYERDGVVLPSEPDLVLQGFFRWAERLGVFGGNLVYDAIKPDETQARPSSMQVPDDYSLALDGDVFRVESKRGGWSFAIPYYFMIWLMTEYETTNGQRAQVVSISTGAAAHQGIEGHSQATLMVMAGPGEDPVEFESYWRTSLGFSGSEPTRDLPVGKLTSRARFDPATSLHAEVTSWRTRSGPIVVAYMGINGPYQWNRPHFIDFLRSIHSTDSTSD